MALPIKDKQPGLYGLLSNKWVASVIIAAFGVGLAWTGNYTILWPAFSGANQLIASIVMITVAVWVKKKLDPKYTNIVLIPAVFLWITVTAALVWYELVIIPTHFVEGADAKKMITGVVVGLITLVMLVLNFIMVGAVAKNFKGKE
jgi:carbon starvation protein